jgi:hypothetical protein
MGQSRSALTAAIYQRVSVALQRALYTHRECAYMNKLRLRDVLPAASCVDKRLWDLQLRCRIRLTAALCVVLGLQILYIYLKHGTFHVCIHVVVLYSKNTDLYNCIVLSSSIVRFWYMSLPHTPS